MFLAAVPQFGVRDVQRTAEYYRDVLGFRVRSYWDGERRTAEPLNRPVFGIVCRDQVEIFFYQSTSAVPQGNGGYHAYFHVKGVDALARQWQENGAEILDGPEDMSYGQREIVIRDPNGLVLAFGESLDQNSNGSMAS
jgi:catechol 2,3-dioxygenase-like lactoylglutathione lyase family enzyme